MKIKTSELDGVQLDWAVAKAEGFAPFTDGISWIIDDAGRYKQLPKYSTNWAQGGPIIEREKISIEWTGEDWMAYIWHDEEFFGSTPLLTAMCCYVASKLGDEIELSEELTTFKT